MADHTNAVNEALRFPLGDAFERDVTELLANGSDIVVATIDMDSFLHVNNAFGMEAGDAVLIAVGRHMRDSLSGDVNVYRCGGDQFAAVFACEEAKEDVFLRMESLRAAMDVRTPDGERVTISVGIAASPEDGAEYLELMRMAEGALYRAKRMGHDRVCLAREEKMVTKTSHYTEQQLKRLTKVSKREGTGEAILLREALDMLLKKYDA